MISDTLSDAAHEIRQYLENYPDVYAGMEDKITSVLMAMDALREELDTPPKKKAKASEKRGKR